MIRTATLLVSNIHCPSCVSYAQDVLHHVAGIHSPIDVSLISQTIRVRFDEPICATQKIVDALLDAAFEVQHVSVIDEANTLLESFDLDAISTAAIDQRTLRSRRAKRKHLDNCDACRKESIPTFKDPRTWEAMNHDKPKAHALLSSASSPRASTGTSLVDRPVVIEVDSASNEIPADEHHYVATISIGGMTCTSCSTAITEALNRMKIVISAEVNLVAHYATVHYTGLEANSANVIQEIEDLGYEAGLDSLLRQATAEPKSFQASLSIEGMTCGSCVATITEALEKLPTVVSVNVDLVGATGVVKFREHDRLNQLLETLDELGYDATLVSLTDPSTSRIKPAERDIQIQVDGMYCPHCCERIEAALEQLKSSGFKPESFEVTNMPTLKTPRIGIRYIPSPTEHLAIRRFVSTIGAVDPNFRVSLYHPPSLEERTRKLQHKERWLILRRLIFSAIVAVPTLIIGVVFMMAVPSSNPTRMWLEEPIWAGSVMRAEWALLIMTTPVMFYGADWFHRRAFKEIWSMWRPGSKVPFLRRFYRFGSMNLLISAATMVAYFASLAVLIINAGTNPTHDMHQRASQTYFDTVTFLTFFILIGRFLEAYSKAKTGDAVSALTKLRPTDALLIEDGEIKSVPADHLEVGDSVQIPHGHSPPSDGTLAQDGAFLFDESSLTGESRPVKKSKGDPVYTGTVNISDPVKIIVTETGGSSVLDNIIQVVREGQAKRAPAERFADVLTAYFTPVITVLAIATWLIWLGLGLGGQLKTAWKDVQQGGWAFWSLEFAIAVFVVACPCGIGLAAPTALFVGGGLAAKHGILVQGGGEAFQEASKLDTVVFDKTGTLTEGQMKVAHFEMIIKECGEQVMLAMARIMEDVSTHPIAKAISAYCQQSSIILEDVHVEEVPGLGMKANFTIRENSGVRQCEAAIGNEKLLASLNQRRQDEHSEKSEQITTKISEKLPDDKNFFLSSLLQKHQSLGHSTAILAFRTTPSTPTSSESQFSPIGVFAISDPIRAEAPSIISSLRSRGLSIHMCTGDNAITAIAIASQLNIPVANIRANALPHEKAAYINELQTASSSRDAKSSRGRNKPRVVAFVGDGTNDTPALTAASVSIALASGSDIALTSSSFILLNSNLTTILTLISLSRRVFRRVLLNFAWALVYNVSLIPAAAGVFFMISATENHGGWRLSPVWASVAMAGSSVSVVLSSLALRLPEFSWKRMTRWALSRKN